MVTESGRITASGSLLSYGYSEDYGESYGGPTPTTRAVSTGSIPTTATTTGTESTLATESGTTPATGTPTGVDVALVDESGSLVATGTLDVLEVTEPRFEQGTIPAQANFNATETAFSAESGSLEAVATLDGLDVKVGRLSGATEATAQVTGTEASQATEAGQTASTLSYTITESGYAFESGETTTLGDFDSDPLAFLQIPPTSFSADATLSGFDVAQVIESGSINAESLIFYTPFVQTDARDPVAAIVDILTGINNQFWTMAPPDSDNINPVWETTEKGRQNNPENALYVWSPTDTDIQQFDGEYSQTIQNATVEVQVWTLDEGETERGYRDVVNILTSYANNNESITNFQYIRPQTMADNRSEKIARQTDHYIASVQIETRYFRDVGGLTR